MLEKIRSKEAKIAIIGLGYVGLPLAVEAAKAGFNVLGIDIDEKKIEMIRNAQSYVQDVSDEELSACVLNNRLHATVDYSCVRDVDIIDIAVPTPLSKSKTPDISFILKAMESIKKYLEPGKLIILESTTYPGTTRELIVNELELIGCRLDIDFYAAFSPERVDPGNPIYKTRNTPKVIGGASEKSTELAEAFYSLIVDQTVVVNSCEEAEMCKLLENSFRAVNIAFVNEMAMMCDKMGINVWNVINAAKTKPFGFMPFYPGPGIGGHCIPLDPVYLSWKAKHFGFYNRSIELASDINENMVDFTVEKLFRILNKQKKALNGSNVLMLGIAYKKDVNDVRESPALMLYEKLKKYGSNINYYDPLVPVFTDQNGSEVRSIEVLNKSILNASDVVLMVTPHSGFDYNFIFQNSNIIFDTRNAFEQFRSERVEVL